MASDMLTQRGSVPLPGDEGLLAHCRRVAALANLVTHHLFLPSEEKDLLDASCLLHHYEENLHSGRPLKRLLADIFEGGASLPDGGDLIPPALREVLDAYRFRAAGSAQANRLAGILRLCDAFDQEMEAQPIDMRNARQILETLRAGVEAGLWPKEAVAALEESTCPAMSRSPESWRVPVFPRAATQILNLMRDPHVNLPTLARAAGMDPSTAGRVMLLANSALFGARTPVSTLPQAISRLGFAATQKVLLSLAVQPLLATPELEELWPHALAMADIAEQLACRTILVDPAEAYLAGLLHDVGRMAINSADLYSSARIAGLERSSCPPVYAESLIMWVDHAALGAQICEDWRLPARIVDAVRLHHRPEASSSHLSHALYLAEYLTGGEEDAPSLARLTYALNGLGLSFEDLDGCVPSATAIWLAVA
jgi:putative nucleotidyltransferase with HDIG domain